MTTACLSCPLPAGTAECHCATCGEHFTTPTNFDRHRRGGACMDPASVGLVPASGRRPGARVWARPPREGAPFQAAQHDAGGRSHAAA